MHVVDVVELGCLAVLQFELVQHLVEQLERRLFRKIKRVIIWSNISMNQSSQLLNKLPPRRCLPRIYIDAATTEKRPLLNIMQRSSRQRRLPNPRKPGQSHQSRLGVLLSRQQLGQ